VYLLKNVQSRAKVELLNPSNSGSPIGKAVIAMEAQWRVAFPGWPVSDFARENRQVKEFGPGTAQWYADYPDPHDVLSVLWTTNPHCNRYALGIPQVDTLCSQADDMSELSARIPLYQQIEQLLVEQGAAIPYAQPVYTYAIRSRVVGWRMLSYVTPLSVWQATYLTR
jgi:ABC-type oligopeptide transport system substrate-binding subunit